MSTGFWESLRLGFLQLRQECAINPPIAPAGRLIAIWTAQPEPGYWRLDFWNGTDGSGVTARFKWHAQNGAVRLGFTGDGDAAVSYWLDRLRRDAPHQYLRENRIEGPDVNPRHIRSKFLMSVGCPLNTAESARLMRSENLVLDQTRAHNCRQPSF